MTSLTLKNVPQGISDFEEVEVPEFGEDENGDPFVVRVRGMSVYEWDLLQRRAWELAPEGNGNGPNLSLREDYNERCLVAAMCSYDDEDQLVFGVDLPDAEQRVRGLSFDQYGPAISRIHRKALELTGLKRGQKQAKEQAEKN